MRKAEERLAGWIIMAAIILAPIGWVFEKVGGTGLSILLVMLIGGFLWWRRHKKKRDQAAFDKVALMVLRNELTLDEIAQLRRALERAHFGRSALLGNLKILRESLYLCLNSKNRDVAESRMEAVNATLNEIRHDWAYLVSPFVLHEIEQEVHAAREQYSTRLYLNIAKGHTDKAHKLKTQRSKLKYLDLAKQALQEGLGNAGADTGALRQALAEVELEWAHIGGDAT